MKQHRQIMLVCIQSKHCSRSQIMSNTISLKFKKFTLVEVDFRRKNPKGSLQIDEKEVDGWTLVTQKKKRHQVLLGYNILIQDNQGDANQLQP